MRLLYATSLKFPSPLANRIQILAQSRAFAAELKGDFLLGVAADARGETEGMPVRIMGEDTKSYRLAWQYLQLAWRTPFTHVYCREEKLLFYLFLYHALCFWKPRLIFCFELHHLEHAGRWWYRWMLPHMPKIISITKGMADLLETKGIPSSRIITAPDAVDLVRFTGEITKEEARTALSLSSNKKLVVYNGNPVIWWKGVGTLYEAMKLLPEEYEAIIVGGKPHYIEEFNSYYPPFARVLLVGQKDHALIPQYLAAADALVLPNSGKQEVSRLSTSPMKLFEFMAMKRPIVASDIPSLREVLDPDTAVLVAPDDPVALAQGIREAVEDAQGSEARAAEARVRVSTRTWEARAKQIIDFISRPV